MKFGQLGLSDEEYVDKIRRTYQGLYRWKWWIGGAIAVLVFCCVTLWVMIARIASNDFFLNPPPPFNSYSQGLGNGFLLGAFAAVVLPGICLAVPTLLMKLRTWRLLLAYHDRLQQAGLLPNEEAESPVDAPLPMGDH